MSVAEDREEDELRVTKYPKLRVLTGGKGPPEPPEEGVNWLADLIPGTTFVARHQNSKEVDWNVYHVVFSHLPEVMFLKWELPDGKLLDYYVDPGRFSRKFKDWVVLGIVKLEPREVAEGGDDGNGNGDRSDRPADVVLHAPVPGEHQLPEE